MDRRGPGQADVSLRVTGVRPDGYHLLDAEMVALDLADTLVFGDGTGLEVGVGRRGGVGPSGADNLVGRALGRRGPGGHVRLVKRIPPGAGLGGGSADAAAVLAGPVRRDLSTWPPRSGPTCPSAWSGGRARVRGSARVVAPLPFEECGQAYTLLLPPFGVSTAAVYRAWDELGAAAGAGLHGGDERPRGGGPGGRAATGRLAGQLADGTGGRRLLAGSGSTWFVAEPRRGSGRACRQRRCAVSLRRADRTGASAGGPADRSRR